MVLSCASTKLPNTRKFHRYEVVSFDVSDFFFLSDRDKGRF